MRNIKKNKSKERRVIIEEKDKLILRELIKNPRTTDKAISTATNIPMKTVNRRRKYLEDTDTVKYMAFVNNFGSGTARFNSICMYTIYFNYGITTEQVERVVTSTEYNNKPIMIKHLLLDFVGEREGMPTYSLTITSRAHEDLVEILNAEIVPEIKKHLGENCIKSIDENAIRMINKTGHNNFLCKEFSGENVKLDNENIFVWD